MYNYYLDQKKKQEQQEQIEREIKELNRKAKRKKEIEKLVENYEGRIKNFLFTMAEKPTKIQEVKQIITSTRKELLEEESNKIISAKGFVFKNFKTEKERINEYLKEKETIYAKQNFCQLPLTERELTMKMKESAGKLVQPSMRFKARTDLERIYDSLRGNNLIEENKRIIYNQLEVLGLNKPRQENAEENEEDTKRQRVKIIRELKQAGDKQKESHNKIYEERKEMQRKRNSVTRKVDNSQAKYLRQELHNKTHFKAAEGLTIFKSTSTVNHELFHKEIPVDYQYYNTFYPFNNHGLRTASEPAHVSNSRHDGILQTSSDQTDTNVKILANSAIMANTLTNFGNQKILTDPDLSKDIANSNPLLFNLNFHILKKNERQDNPLTREQLEKLKLIAFAKEGDEYYPKMEKSPRGFFKKLTTRVQGKHKNKHSNDEGNLKTMKKEDDFNISLHPNQVSAIFNYHPDIQDENIKKPDEEKIKINGEELNKNDIQQIAKKVLTACNFTHLKNKNASSLGKSGSGKLMFTSGMTVTEFVKKYHFLLDNKNE